MPSPKGPKTLAEAKAVISKQKEMINRLCRAHVKYAKVVKGILEGEGEYIRANSRGKIEETSQTKPVRIGKGTVRVQRLPTVAPIPMGM